MTLNQKHKYFLYFAFFLLIMLPQISISQITVLSQDFDSSSSIPSSWSQINVQGTSVWSINNGGTFDLGASHPAAAHSGTRNAYISSQSTSGNVRKLVTPSLDLSGLGNVTLVFWEARLKWGVDTDFLKVYYRTTPSGSWVQLKSYTSATSGWVKRTITLANPSSTYYVAFEGIPKYGYGICIDDVEITASIANDVMMTSVEVKNKEFVNAHFKNLGANNLTSCNFSFTVDGDTSIYTQSWTGNLATDSSATLQIDTFYFSHGLHDIKCWSGNPNSSGDGDRTNDTLVTEYYINRVFPYTQSFENSNLGYWMQSQDDQMNWTRKSGSTTSTGTGPSSAKDGTFYMYTEASGNYNKTAKLVSPDMELSVLTNPHLEVWYHMYGAQIGSLDFDIDSSGTWIEGIDTQITGNQGNTWHKKLISLQDYRDLNKIQLRAKTTNGFLSDIAIDDIKLLDIPSVDLGPDSTICQGNQLSFTADTGVGYSYVWKADGYSDTLSTSNSITVDSSGIYIVIVSAAYGYSATDTVVLTIAPLPVADFVVQSSSQCLNENAFYYFDSSTISSGSFTQLWSFGDNDTSSQQHPIHSYQSDGSYQVLLKLTSNYNCVDTMSLFLQVHPSPIAQFSVNDTDQCVRDNLFQFTNSSTVSSGSINSYFWSFGDTNTSILSNPDHHYQSADTFLVTLIILTDKSCNDTFLKHMYSLPMPLANFNIQDSTQCLTDNQFIFNNLSSISQGTISHSWAFGDNSFSNLKNPTHSYSNAGFYSISLISGSQNGCKDTFVSSAIVYSMPEAVITLDSLDVQCFNNHMFKLSDQSKYTDGYGAFRYWDLGDGNSDTSSQIAFNYSSYGPYSVKLIIQSNYNCSDTAIVNLTLHPSPKSDFTVNPTDQCLYGNVFSFTNSSSIPSGNLNHEWNFGDGNTTSTIHPFYSYAIAGIYEVWLKSVSNHQCADSIQTSITVHPEPQADFSINEEGQCLESNEFEFTNLSSLSSGTFNSEWHLGDGTTSFDLNPIKSYQTTDSFIVTLYVVSDHNCTDSISKIAYINPLPRVGFTIDDSIQCLTGNLFEFRDTSSVISGQLMSYWNFGDGYTSTDTNPAHHYVNSGIYTVKLVATNDFACRDSVSKTIQVLALPVIDLGNDTNLVDTIVFILDAGPGFVNYLWQDNSSQTTFEILTSSLNIGSHVFHVTVEDSNGCSNSDTITLTIFEHISIAENEFELHFHMYPNPAKEYLFIEHDQPLRLDMEMTLFNMEGRKVWSKKYNPGSGVHRDQIDVRQFAKGVYILQAKQGLHLQSFKLLVQ